MERCPFFIEGTLIESRLSSIPLYYFSLFKIQIGVADSLKRIMQDFLWSGCYGNKRDHLVNWGFCCKPKEEGGVGLGNLVSSLVGKWLWRFPLEPDSLWHKMIKSKYGLHLNGWDVKAASNATHISPWKFVSQVYSSFLPLLGFNVGDGSFFHF